MSIPSRPHDALFKIFLKDPENLKAFLREFLPEKLLRYVSLDALTLVPEERIPLSKKKRVIPDLVVEVPFLDRTMHIYILIEHKSSQELRVFSQIGSYILSIFEEDLKAGRKVTPVFPLIYYHGKVSWGLPERFLDLFEVPGELRPYFLDFRLEVVDLTRRDDEELLRKVEEYGMLYGLLWIQKRIWEAELDELVEVLERLISLGWLMGERGRMFFGYLVSYLEVTRGIDPKEVVVRIIEKGGEKVAIELKNFWDVIREEAIKEGIQQGIQRGLILDAQEMVLSALEERFGGIDENITELIKKIENREFLKSLLKLSFRANSLEEILKELEEHLKQ